MKTMNFWKWTLALGLGVLPFLGCGQRTDAGAATIPDSAIISGVGSTAAEEVTNVPAPAEVDRDLETAPAQIVSAPAVPISTLSTPATEVVKLAQAGVDESVMMAYVTNSAYIFNLDSDDIIYLNDVGVPGAVVTAMLQRDQVVRSSSNLASQPPVYTNQLVPAIGSAPIPYDQPQADEVQSAAVSETIPESQPANVSYTYFYDSLAPYGTWINVAGYGLCWQPTVVVANSGWQPYCNAGRWIYSDCGWYWASDYSWGWAPFHYGRWFQHSIWGWCWAPDTVWASSWVCWRYDYHNNYCGWAPLPPSACYKPGAGFTYHGRQVNGNYYAGNARHYAFVPVANFYDRHPSRYRVSSDVGNQAFKSSVPVNSFTHDNRNRVVNGGVPVDQVAATTHREIRPVRIRTTDQPVQVNVLRMNQNGERALPVYRPDLPQPKGTQRLAGEGVPAARESTTRTGLVRGSRIASTPANTTTPALGTETGRRNHENASSAPSVFGSATSRKVEPLISSGSTVQSGNAVRSSRSTSNLRANEPLIIRGGNRTEVANNNVNAEPQRTWSAPTRDNETVRGSGHLIAPVGQGTAPVYAPGPTWGQNSQAEATTSSRQDRGGFSRSAPVVQPSSEALPQSGRQMAVPQNLYRAPVSRQPDAPRYQVPRTFEPQRSAPSIQRTMPSSQYEVRSVPSLPSRQMPEMRAPAASTPTPTPAQPSMPSGGSSRQSPSSARGFGRGR